MVHASRDKLLGLFFELTHFRVPLAVLVAIRECLLLCHKPVEMAEKRKNPIAVIIVGHIWWALENMHRSLIGSL